MNRLIKYAHSAISIPYIRSNAHIISRSVRNRVFSKVIF